MHGWEIHKNGNTWGVLASFYTPAQASSYIQQYKAKLANMRMPTNELANEDAKSAFSILGLDQTCTREQFINEYRKKVMLYHPDLNSNSEIVKDHFNQITTAAHQIRNVMGW
jgi:DnaJ-class molecular chaperone